MGLDCCCRFLKIITIIVNTVIIIVGIAALALGILLLISSNVIEKTNEQGFNGLIVICAPIIAVGALLTVVGFFGCCGAAYENQCLLVVFILLMVVALGIVIAGAILAGAHKEEIKDKLAKTVTDTFANLTKENSEVANAIQELFQCCGAKDYKDWTKANLPIPVSCCVDSDNECNVKPQAFLFRKNCNTRAKEWGEYFFSISPLIFGLAGIAETLAIVTSLGLCCYFRRGAY